MTDGKKKRIFAMPNLLIPVSALKAFSKKDQHAIQTALATLGYAYTAAGSDAYRFILIFPDGQQFASLKFSQMVRADAAENELRSSTGARIRRGLDVEFWRGFFEAAARTRDAKHA